VVGERGEFGGVAAEPLHLVDGEDDAGVWGAGLDLGSGGERGLELGADPDTGADLLPGDPVFGERVQLGIEFLYQPRAGIPPMALRVVPLT
jgi:hypothetical protein